MPEIATTRADLRALRGLHLWHAGLSNCSQRVRLILEEKRLRWISHVIDLLAFEHATPDYQSIHPKGLVPALIHNGQTVTDSNDIISYLDIHFPHPTFGVRDGADLLELADDSQLSLRTVSHELLLGDTRRLDPDTLARFARDHGNREFYQFLCRFSTEGFDDRELRVHLARIGSALTILEQRLGRHKYLTGAEVALPDFTWVTNVHRLRLIDYPLWQYPLVASWFGCMENRDSFNPAITAFETNLPKPGQELVDRRRRNRQQLSEDGAVLVVG